MLACWTKCSLFYFASFVGKFLLFDFGIMKGLSEAFVELCYLSFFSEIER